MSYFLNILFSEKLNKYYIGATKDVSGRLKNHLWKHKGFTAKANDWELCYSEVYKTKSEAFERERQIKK